ncbi:E3 ubiquitin-protein ligase UBR3 [Microtus ochrogaster]|uniref:E3 ubiquitin-protein ligase n=1 Tax=Microtus ochrogaster TaxID=79684 RepID=A0A8J6KK16_MICOH|nr:E3 ubiquitin-protein ligase UBR3 [Microtus ochrogaster]
MAAAAAAAVGGPQPAQSEVPEQGPALDKAATAAHLKAALSRPDNRAGAEELQALLERVLNAERPLAGAAGGEEAAGGGGGPGAAEEDALEWCKCLLAGGGGYDEFCAAVRAYDPAALCGLVWTANFVAYRCRTCGISPCMSLCAECFHQGDHTGHDFNMFRSQAGGACDCGDSNVMRESLGENTCAKKSHEKYLIALKSSGLTYPEDKLVYGMQEPSAGTSTLLVQDQSIMDVLKHKSFLEELLFWTIKYEFPQKMVTFLLNMLPDQEYKVAFTKTFVQHYAFIMKTLKKSHESDTMSNRIVHISVQLFSNEELARQETQEYTRNVVRYCLEALQDWFDAINFVDEASLAEIHSNMWVRNGLQIKGQAMTYVQSHFCNSMIDPDIYLLQVCASRLDPDYFISSVFERFKVVDLLTMASQHHNTVLDVEHERSMLEGALTFLVILLSLRLHLENPNPKSGIIPGSYSFESVLSTVADFKAPVFEPGGSMQQGMYTPKAEVWDQEFDPVMVILRTVYRRDVQSAMDRYTAFLKQSGKFPGNPWPPYKKRTSLHPSYKGLMRLLHCKTLHIVLFTLLYKILMDHQNLSEHVLCMVLYLIELGLENSAEDDSEEEVSVGGPERCHDSWFPGSNLVSNMRHFINYVRVRVPETAPELKRDSLAGTSSDDLGSLQNSGTAQVFSLVAERRKKFQEIINRSSSEANQVIRPPYTPKKWSAPGSAPPLTTAILEIKESILSLLIKLHHKLSGKQNSYYPPWLDDIEVLIQPEIPKYNHGDGITAVERILLKSAMQSRMNKRIIEEICRKVNPPVPPKKITAAEKKTLDKEERRQKARERQQKLLAEFASRQKSFMETAMDVDSPENEIPMEIAAAEPQVSEAVYDCVICGQSGPSSEDRPAGLVVLLQASSVLGQCRDNAEPKKLPISEEEQIYPWDTCAAVHDVRLSLLQRYFKDSSCLLAVSIGWEGGVYVQTCGHTLHIDCHKSYMESLRNDQVLQGFSVDKGEFTCPLCRQFANSVLPCYPGSNVESNLWQRPSNKSTQDLIKEVEELQGRPGAFPSETNLSKEMESVMKDIKNTTQKKYRDYSKTPGSPDNDFLFMYSVARTNLELELIHRGGSLCSGGASTAGKRSCLNQLFHVLALHMRLYTIDSEYNPWKKLTQLIEDMNSQLGNEEHQPEVPILYHDVTSLLLIQILMMPQPLRKEHFSCIVKVLFTLLYTQALAALSVKGSEEDRSAWKHAGALRKNTCDAEKSCEVLLSFVISELSKGKLYCEEGTQECAMVSPFAWSPESMEKYIQAFCLPFLRISSLLQHHLFGEDLPSCQEEEEFSVLASCLGLLPAFYQTDHPFLSASCLDWPVTALDIITQWCSEIRSFTERHAEQGKALLIQESRWKLPHLLQLPENYNTIFQYYHRKTCSVCTKVPKDPAVCLVCGTFVCLKGLCCKQQSYCECVLHSQNCGAGTGIFLLINASVIIIIRGHRFCLWGSVYLDAHGEEDRDLRRGKPLYICEERYRVLEQQWIAHTFDHINKRWGPHYNGL